MATSKNSNTYNRQGWEDSEFPALCQTCLGDNPYIRMLSFITRIRNRTPSAQISLLSDLTAKNQQTKERFGKECKICARPFTVFRWNPGSRMRFKKTEVCQTCAKLKNVCQTCLLDLEYGLPVQVRDSALKMKDDLPKSDVNKEFYLQNTERQLAGGEDGGALALAGSHGKAQAPSDMLLKLARTTPYYKRNRPHICSFWVKGECKRGEECPYRHEKPTDPDDPLADQNIKDRFYGQNDPVADKLMRRYTAMPKLGLPEDRSITTLYVGNVTDDISEQDLKNHFYQFGEVRSISLVKASQCAFVQFTQRSAAEAAVDKSFNKLIIRGKRLNIKWGKSQAQQQALGRREGEDGAPLEPVPGLPGALPPPPQDVASNFFNLSQPPPPLPLPPGVGPAPTLPSHGATATMGPIMPPRGLPPPLPPGVHHLPPPMRPPPMPPRALVHYPSQDPTRMGAIGVKAASEKS